MIELHNAGINSFLEKEFRWLKQIINLRFESFFDPEFEERSIDSLTPPIIGIDTAYEQYLLTHELGLSERIVVAMALASTLQPEIFNLFHIENKVTGKNYSEFGGIMKDNKFTPTYRTAAFILNDEPQALPTSIYELFEQAHPFTASGIMNFSASNFQNRLDTPIKLGLETEYYILTGLQYKSEFNSDFPAQEIETALSWEDLIISDQVNQELNELLNWFKYEDMLSNDAHYAKWVKKGYRALFYGPSGTGKTLTASLLGKTVNRPVYRVDLSMVVSKYIGETIKNLEKVFFRAERNNWILFFDEADAIFGNRTSTSSSNDRHANQEVAYLLQRIESFPGLIILATNLKNNIDEAFSRRFQSIIHFQLPDQESRYKLWNTIFEATGLSSAFIKEVSEKYELTGGSLINVLQTARITSDIKKKELTESAVLFAIRKELKKGGKRQFNL